VLPQGTAGIAKKGSIKIDTVQWIEAEFNSKTGWLVASYVALRSQVTPTPPAQLSDVTVSLDCTSNPERIIIANNGGSTIGINSITTLVDVTAAEPFVLNQPLSGRSNRTYQAGSGASGQFVLSSSLILTNSSQEGVRVETSVGSVTTRCPTTPTGEKWIEVNLSTQRLTAWQGSSRISSSLASTGRPGFETPTGTFHILYKYLAVDMQGCAGGECWFVPQVPHAMAFTNYGHFIHGAYWHNNFGETMSHGCVNLPLSYAEWLYYWAPIGTRVWIHY
jgi:lipoprotein-anchoring transpeptidase ErfK/SrfK